MNTISVNYTLVWQLSFTKNYQFTENGKCFNVKTGKELKQSYNGGSIGYNIHGKFKSLSYLRKHLQKIKSESIPF